MDKIKIEKLEVFAYHGCNEYEKENGQLFIVSATLYLDFYNVSHTDELQDTVSFPFIVDVIRKTMLEEKYNTIELVAEKVAQHILQSFNIINKVKVNISKPAVAKKFNSKEVSIEIERQWHNVFISYGSNIGDSENILNNVINNISQNKNIHLMKDSTRIKTKPYKYLSQPDFLNGCCMIQTLFHQKDLLLYLQKLEQEYGRERTIKNGPRTLDLDILFYDDIIYDDGCLIIPHLDIENRDFVLEPMNEICPNYVHPIIKKTMSDMYNELVRKKM